MCEYRKMVESGRVLGKGRISTSIEKISRRVQEEYRICEYGKMVESERVPGKGRIGTSIERLSPREPEKGRICVCIEKW